MFSYTNPGTSLKDQVRFLVGDTKANDPFLQDEEIRYLLQAHQMEPNTAAIAACEAILSQLARSRDESVGSVSISFSQSLAGYEKMLARLKLQLALSGGIAPYAGGISIQDKRSARRDGDWQRPDFSTDMMRSQFVTQYLHCETLVGWEQYPL